MTDTYVIDVQDPGNALDADRQIWHSLTKYNKNSPSSIGGR